MTGALTLERKASGKSEKPIEINNLGALAGLADKTFVSLALSEDTPPAEGILFKSPALNIYTILQRGRNIIHMHRITGATYAHRAITPGTPGYDVNKQLLESAGRWHLVEEAQR